VNSVTESGGAKIRILVLVLILGAAAYYGNEIGGVYWRKYRLADAVDGQMSFVGQRSDEGIRARILQDIEHMNLPPAARRFTFVRNQQAHQLQFSTSYSETVNLLFTKREISLKVNRARRF